MNYNIYKNNINTWTIIVCVVCMGQACLSKLMVTTTTDLILAESRKDSKKKEKSILDF